MTPAVDAVAGERLGREIVAAIADRDWPRFAACLAPDVTFRAVVPSREEPFREHVGPDAATAQMARWFDGGEAYDLVDSTVEMVGDRLHVGYRATGIDEGTWYLVEQHLFATVADGRAIYVNLLCTGFRDIDPPG